jgi:predicted nuclease of predicted toxin-antitoxin system
LPIISFYHGRQNSPSDTAAMMDALLAMLEVPTVGHADAIHWRRHGVDDFEDALQVASAIAGNADILITRNTADFAGAAIKSMAPEAFLAVYP